MLNYSLVWLTYEVVGGTKIFTVLGSFQVLNQAVV